jgi:hypothetical protein
VDNLPAHIVQRFSHHPPLSGERISRHEAIREATMQLAVIYEELLPGSREASLAQTALQEAAMWANGALALHEDAYTEPQPATN